MTSPQRIAVLGAGPVGLDAALAGVEAGHDVTVYEAAPEVAGGVRAWGHVRLFTPWSLSVSPRQRRALGADAPDGDGCPTGRALADRVLAPLAAGPLAGRVRTGTRVVAVGRRGLLKHEEIASAARAARPFRLLLEDAAGRQWTAEHDVVLDCTGASVPNSLGDAGIPAPGEARLDGALSHAIPDLASDGDAWAGRRVLLAGAGHSAQTALRAFAEADETHRPVRVVWLRRRDEELAVAADDPLPERAALASHGRRLAAAPPPWLDVRVGSVAAVDPRPEGVHVTLGDGAEVVVDRVLALTGRVGDHLLYRQLQVHECYATCGPMSLSAALLGAAGGTGGDCLAQSSMGADTLKNPEPGFFILGAKSYGRRNDFLLRVGWQQVDEAMSLVGA